MQTYTAFVFDTSERKFKPAKIRVENGIISKITKASAPKVPVYIIPGLIDVHTHGRCGYDIMASPKDELSKMSLEYAKVGTTSLFPTVMTAPLDNVTAAILSVVGAKPRGARFLGVHVEGPYISKEKRGCHDASYIRMPDKGEMTDIVNKISPLKAHFTVAPENCPSGLVAALSTISTVGIGHTGTDFKTAMSAVYDGAVSFTHTFNAMTQMTQREAGVVGAALYSGAYAEFIVDGFHVSPEVISIAYQAKKKQGDKFVLITDSIPQAGLPDGRYEMNGIEFTLSGKSAKRDDGTIVGSATDLYTAVKNLSAFADISFEEALICATKNPAEMVGIYDKVGSIDVGKYADFIVLDQNRNITSVYVGGERII